MVPTEQQPGTPARRNPHVQQGERVACHPAESSGTTNHWAAGRGDRRDAAYALFSTALRRKRLWAVFGNVALALTLVGIDSGAGVWGALLYGIGWVALVAAVVLGLLYVNVRRRFARQLPPGLVLESEFGPDFVVLRAPWSENRLQFLGIDQVRPCSRWILHRNRRSRITSVWPAALFPPEQLARLQQAIGNS